MSDEVQPAPRIREIGNCEVLEKVGQGGMGTVFRARQKSLDRIVALKILPPSVAKDATFIDRFQREARASAKLSHPHVVNGIDVGQDAATGLWYFVMEFVDGPSLKDVQKKRGILPEEEALKITRQIASALDCLAAHGMVHRDIKPDNIMLTERGDAKLADLGLAKDLKEDSSLTQSGRAVGTPYYMSPEQVRGETTGIDIRTDIYALGGTLFHLITGRPPFQGETSAVIMAKHLTDTPPLANKVNGSVTEGCARMIVRMMQKKKEDRVQSPRELMDIIDKVMAGEYAMTTGARSAIRGTGPRQPVKPRTAQHEKVPAKFPLMPIAAVGALALMGAAAYFMMGDKKPVASAQPDNGKTPGRTEVAPKKPEVAEHKNPSSTATVAKPSASPSAQKGPATALLDAARKYEEQNPTAIDEILRHYKEAAKRAANTPEAAGVTAAVEKAIAAVEARRNTAADEVWKDIETQVQAASNGGDIDSALEVVAKLPEAYAGVLTDRAEALATRLRDGADTKIGAALKAAEDAIARAEPQAGLDALAAVETTRYAPRAESVKAMKERLTEELANVAQLKDRREIRDARMRLNEHLAKFEKALLEERNLAQAKTLAEETVKDAALKPIEKEAQALAGIIAAHEDYNARTLAALDVLKGRQIKINKEEGILGDVKDGMVSLKIPGPGGGNNVGIKKIKLSDMNEALRRDLLKVEWGTTPAARVAVAMIKLREPEDLPGATVMLADATEDPLHAVYHERLQIRLRGADEVAAEKGWPAIQALDAKKPAGEEQALASLAQIDDYLKAYGHTKFVKSQDVALGSMRAALQKAMIVNLVKNGDFEDNDATGLALWKREAGADFLINEKKRNGTFGFCMVGVGRIYQLVDVQPGVAYRLTASISGAGACSVQGALRALGGPERDPKSQLISFVAGEPGNGTVWKPIEIVFTSLHPKMEVSFEKSVAAGFIYIDDVVLTKASNTAVVAVAPPVKTSPAMPPATPTPPPAATPVSTVNLVANNGFEQGLTGWEQVRAQVHTQDVHAGRNCALVQNKGKISQTIKTDPGFTYNVSLWMRGKTIVYLVLDKNERTYREMESEEWARWNTSFPGTGTSHVVEFSVRGNGYIDDITVVKGAALPVDNDAVLAAQLPPDYHVLRGHAYKVFKDQVNWAEAKKACEKMGGHLVHIESEGENEFLSKIAEKSGKDVWIGLFDPQGLNQWSWTDGKRMTYNGFDDRGLYKRQQPRAARYAQFVGYNWAEDPIEKMYFFMCEWDTIPEKLLVKKPAAPVAAPAPPPEKKKSDE